MPNFGKYKPKIEKNCTLDENSIMKQKQILACISILFFFIQGLFAGDTTYATPKIQLVQFGSANFSRVSDISHCGDGRLFITEQTGRIWILDAAGIKSTIPYLNITNRVNSGGNEQGLLGLTFHPDYANNGKFYLNYTSGSGNGKTVIANYLVSTHPDSAQNLSETVILQYTQPFSNHNGGDINFGPDGYLYIASGDGGSAGDPNNNGQKKNTFLGKLLRIDVNNGSPYSVPSSNPFVGNSSYNPEIWALGLRNPWRFSFDRITGDMWIGDVGQNVWEEINYQEAGFAGGANYGWRCYEGNHNHNTTNCQPMSAYDAPIYEYNHSSGACSVTGGYVYRGLTYKGLQGWYIATDYCNGVGHLIKKNGSTLLSIKQTGMASGNITTFGENKDGELFASVSDKIYKVTDACNGFFIAKTIIPTCSGSNDGVISLSVNGGQGTKTYSWSNGATTQNISGLTGGLYRLTITDGQGCQIVDSITVPEITPTTPIISFDPLTNTITSTPAEAYQWFLNGNPIGDNQQTITVSESGSYSVQTTDVTGCVAISEPVSVVVSGIDQNIVSALSIFPNPSKGVFTIRFASKKAYFSTIQVVDILGQEVDIVQFRGMNNEMEYVFDLSHLPTGVYTFIVKTTEGDIAKRVMKY